MSKISSEQFIEIIQKSRLVEPAALETQVQQIRSEHEGGLPADPVEIAKAFQKSELLTRWHCEKLLQGKYKGFFLGKHKLLGLLGTGGMSTVYLAEHTVMKHKRAIKVLPKTKLGNSSYLARFQREAKAIASLSHPNIVKAYDIDNEKDTHYLVMEYVEGADLQTLVKRSGPLPYDLAAEYIAQAARGLQHAHEVGLIHRDVKPANILVNIDGDVKVLDLGLALFADESQASLTMDYNDKVLGTADYLAPEQALNSHKVDGRADIYGLGCSLYFLLTGHPPFPDGTIAQRIAKHQKLMPEDIRKDRPDCPGELEGICVKMMQKDPKFRYANCNLVADVLEKWLANYRATVAHRKAKVQVSPGGSGPSLMLGSDVGVELRDPKRVIEDAETVSNRGGDTMGGKLQGSSVLNLSTSDSGVLRAIADQEYGSRVDSTLDLEKEIAKRVASNISGARSSAGDSNKQNVSSTSRRPANPQSAGKNRPNPVPVPKVERPPFPGSSLPRWLILLILGIMFLSAVLLGIVIAKLTPDPTRSSAIESPVLAGIVSTDDHSAQLSD